MDQIKQEALRLAHRSDDTDDNNVARAEKYEKFLRGQTGSTQTPLPIADDGQPDALHG